ncbi:MAG: FAD-dependent oxidoreductase [Chitinophagales bacterium]
MSAAAMAYDVVICGAGSAGIAAAVQAANCGMKTALIERLNFPGGKATAAEVRTLCGFYYSGRKKAEFLHRGFPKAFAEKIMQAGGTKPLSFDRDLHFIPYNPLHFKIIAEQFLKESGVDIYYHSWPLAVRTNTAGKIESLNILNKDRKLEFQAKYVIDCSGESMVAALMDLPQLKDKAYQSATQVFTLGNIALPDDALLNMIVNKSIAKAVSTGALPESFDRLSVIPGTFKQDSASFKFLIAEKTLDKNNIHSQFEMMARERVVEVVKFLKGNVDGFSKVEISSIASELGIRTGRRLAGKYQLTRNDVLQSKRFADAVARSSWPIEKWGVEKRVSMTYPESGDFYEIPLRSLQSAYCENLLAAGRGICADEDAIASARVIGTCMATGTAAGAFVAEKIKT